MARRDPTIICGKLECSLRSLELGAWSISFGGTLIPEQIHQACTQATVGGTNAGTWDRVFNPILERLLKLGLDDENSRSFCGKKTLSMVQHLANTSERQCGEPRDRIYALYGLLPDLARAYPTDYDKKNKQQILNETAAYLVHREYLPDALYNLTFRGEEDLLNLQDVPSWHPNLFSPSRLSLEVAHSDIYYQPQPALSHHLFGSKSRNPRRRVPITLSFDQQILSLPSVHILGRCQVTARLRQRETDALRQAQELLGELESGCVNTFTESVKPRTVKDPQERTRLLAALFAHTSAGRSAEPGGKVDGLARMGMTLDAMTTSGEKRQGQPQPEGPLEEFYLDRREQACRRLRSLVLFSAMGRLGGWRSGHPRRRRDRRVGAVLDTYRLTIE